MALDPTGSSVYPVLPEFWSYSIAFFAVSSSRARVGLFAMIFCRVPGRDQTQGCLLTKDTRNLGDPPAHTLHMGDAHFLKKASISALHP